MSNIELKCRLCCDKGYSTEYVGASYAMPDFPGDKKYKVVDEGVVKHYCTCEKGRDMNPNNPVNSEYLTDEEYDRMKKDVESRENHITDSGKKSQLRETDVKSASTKLNKNLINGEESYENYKETKPGDRLSL